MGLMDTLGDIAGGVGSVAALPFKGVGSLLGIGGDKPAYWAPNPEEDTTYKDSAEALHRSALTDQGSMVSQEMEGTGAGGDAFKTASDREAQATSLGGNDPGMGDAIQNRQKQRFSAGLAKIQRQSELDAPGRQADRTSIAFQSQMAGANAVHNIQMKQFQADQNSKAMRNQVIGSILGAAGAGAGAMAGPGGAAAGYQAGSSMAGNQQTRELK